MDSIFIEKISHGDLYHLYVDLAFKFYVVKFNTLRFLANCTSMVIGQDWLFFYKCEENNMVFKIAGVSHIVVMKLMAIPR